jgi:hypothetical protein
VQSTDAINRVRADSPPQTPRKNAQKADNQRNYLNLGGDIKSFAEGTDAINRVRAEKSILSLAKSTLR